MSKKKFRWAIIGVVPLAVVLGAIIAHRGDVSEIINCDFFWKFGLVGSAFWALGAYSFFRQNP